MLFKVLLSEANLRRSWWLHGDRKSNFFLTTDSSCFDWENTWGYLFKYWSLSWSLIRSLPPSTTALYCLICNTSVFMVCSNIFIGLLLILHKFILQDLCSVIICVICVPFSSLEKEMATYSSILAWRIPRTVACKAPLSMGSHDLVTKPPPPPIIISWISFIC